MRDERTRGSVTSDDQGRRGRVHACVQALHACVQAFHGSPLITSHANAITTAHAKRVSSSRQTRIIFTPNAYEPHGL